MLILWVKSFAEDLFLQILGEDMQIHYLENTTNTMWVIINYHNLFLKMKYLNIVH